MTHVILKELYEEGKLTRGDTLTHSEKGDHHFQYIDDSGAWVVVDNTGRLERWFVDLDQRVEVGRDGNAQH